MAPNNTEGAASDTYSISTSSIMSEKEKAHAKYREHVPEQKPKESMTKRIISGASD